MAYVINDECTACGLCPQACPTNAISEAVSIYRVNPWLCTECLGFAETPQCAAVCPAGAIVLDGVTAHFGEKA